MASGSIDKRGNQVYRCRISFPKENGKNRTPIVKTVHGSLRQAQLVLREMLDEFEETGTVRKRTLLTLGEWMATYLTDIAALTLKPKSLQTNRELVDRYLPPLHKLILSKVTTPILQTHYGDMIKRGLSPKTVSLLHGVLTTAFKVAVQQSLIGYNPASQVTLPKNRATEIYLGPHSTEADLAGGKATSSDSAGNRSLTPPEGRRLLDALLTPKGLFFELQLLSGCRPGEIAGLLWDSVDYEDGGILIQRSLSWLKGDPPWLLTSPKTKKGVRFIPLPPPTMERLRVHFEEQRQAKHFMGESWQGKLPFVFTNTVGTPVNLSNMKNRVLWPAFEKAGLDPQEFRGAYSLRKSLAQFFLEIGVHMKLVSERMGHSSTSFTQDVYMSSSDRLQRDATDQVAELLGPGLKKPQGQLSDSYRAGRTSIN